MRKLTLTLAAILAILAGPAKADTNWPQRPVMITVGYPAGGTTDIVARLVANELQKSMNSPVLVENRPGAAGVIGTTAVATSNPDGYTLLFTIGSHTVVPAVVPTLSYDTVKSFAPIAIVGTSPNMLLVRADHPAKSLADFIKLAKAQPDKIDYGTPGIGTTTHVTGAMLEKSAGIKLSHIPYKGSGPTTQALLSGEIPAAFASIISAGQFVREGRIRALAIVGTKRSPMLPDVPTFEEQGAPNVLGDNWLGLLAPAKTPKNALDKLVVEMRSLLARQDFQATLARQGVQADYKTPAEFTKVLETEVAAFKELATTVSLKAD